jgi:uncharacterized protein with HEPN domain
MPPHKASAPLFDIVHAANGVAMFMDGKTPDDLTNDLMLRMATERQLEIIGEALNRLHKVAPDVAERITDYPRIIGLRNVLIHGYDTIKLDLIWTIVQQHLPILKREVQNLMDEIGDA